MENNATNVISLCAAIVALSALGVSIYQSYLMRKHNRLSLRPFLNLDHSYNDLHPISIKVFNNGCGPAIVKNVDFKINGNSVNTRSQDEFIAAFADIDIDLNRISFSASFPKKQAFVKAGDQFTIISFDSSHTDKELHAFLMSKLSLIEVNVEYECMYNIKYQTSVV